MVHDLIRVWNLLNSNTLSTARVRVRRMDTRVKEKTSIKRKDQVQKSNIFLKVDQTKL